MNTPTQEPIYKEQKEVNSPFSPCDVHMESQPTNDNTISSGNHDDDQPMEYERDRYPSVDLLGMGESTYVPGESLKKRKFIGSPTA